MPARTRIRGRRSLTSALRHAVTGSALLASPSGAGGDAAAVSGGQAGAGRHELARQAHLVAGGRHQAELSRPLLDAARRLERGQLHLELAIERLDLLPLAAQAIQLVGQAHLLHAQADHAESAGAHQRRPTSEEGGR